MSVNDPDYNPLHGVSNKLDVLKFSNVLECSKIKIDFKSSKQTFFINLIKQTLGGFLLLCLAHLFYPNFFLSGEGNALSTLVFYACLLCLVFGIVGFIMVKELRLMDRSQRLIYRNRKVKYKNNSNGEVLIHFDDVKLLALTGRLTYRKRFIFDVFEYFEGYFVHECMVSVVHKNNQIFQISDWYEISNTKQHGNRWSTSGLGIEPINNFAKSLAYIIDTEFIDYPEFGGNLIMSDNQPSYEKMNTPGEEFIKRWWPLRYPILLAIAIFIIWL